MLILLDGFELAKLSGQLLIFLRLTGLTAQICKLGTHLADDILKALEIGFGGLEAQLGLMAAA